jgi:hypothetical protein
VAKRGDWNTDRSPKGLTFEGKGGRIDASWKLPKIAMQVSSTVFLRLQQGAEQVLSGQVQSDFSDGDSAMIDFFPNRHTAWVCLKVSRVSIEEYARFCEWRNTTGTGYEEAGLLHSP